MRYHVGMNSYFDHRITDAERDAFDRDGYLIIENALTGDAFDRVLAAVDRIDREQRDAGAGPHDLVSLTDLPGRDDAFIDLMAHETVFPKIWGVLGWNIYLYHAHMDVTPPADESRRVSQPSYRAWHQDSMRVNDEIECHPRPRLSVKVAYFLSDTTVTDCGAMHVWPGSHLHDEIDMPQGGHDPAGAIPLAVKPGTAVIFDRRLWHSRSLNTSQVTRKGVFLGYAYRWLQPKDDMQVDHLYDKVDPIRRQLLGWKTSSDGLYAPTSQDVPLYEMLKENNRLDSARDYHRGVAAGKSPR